MVEPPFIIFGPNIDTGRDMDVEMGHKIFHIKKNLGLKYEYNYPTFYFLYSTFVLTKLSFFI